MSVGACDGQCAVPRVIGVLESYGFLCVCFRVCVCVCACERESAMRKGWVGWRMLGCERGNEDRGSKRAREWGGRECEIVSVCMCVCVLKHCVLKHCVC